MVVVVGVDAQIGAPRPTEGRAPAEHPGHPSVAGHPVDHAVGRVAEPGAPLDAGVGGIVAREKGKGAVDRAALIRVHVEPPPADIFLQQSGRGIVVSPLAGVSVQTHIGAGGGVHCQQGVQIPRFGGPYHGARLLSSFHALGYQGQL